MYASATGVLVSHLPKPGHVRDWQRHNSYQMCLQLVQGNPSAWSSFATLKVEKFMSVFHINQPRNLYSIRRELMIYTCPSKRVLQNEKRFASKWNNALERRTYWKQGIIVVSNHQHTTPWDQRPESKKPTHNHCCTFPLKTAHNFSPDWIPNNKIPLPNAKTQNWDNTSRLPGGGAPLEPAIVMAVLQ